MLLLAAGCKKESDEVRTPLHQAVADGKKEEVLRLLRQGADIEAKDFSGRTPLHQAAIGSRGTDMITLLLDNHANINAQDKWGYTVLHRALHGGRMDMARLLLTRGAYVKTQSQSGETPLHEAARFGLIDLVRQFVAKGAGVNVVARNGDTPLLCTVELVEMQYYVGYNEHPPDYEHLQVIRFLIGRGADVNAMNKDGETPLSRAARCGDLELVQLLADSGAKLSRASGPDRNLAILAMNRNHLDVAKFLVAQGADVTLHLAAYVGDLEKAKALIQNGDVNAHDQVGQTPLHMAARTGQREMADLLLSNGADVNGQVEGGWTPLHEAARSGHENVAKLLIARGAVVNARMTPPEHETIRNDLHAPHAQVGTTPLHLAVNYPEVVKVLVANGADINAKDERDETPIHLAATEGDKQVVDLLLAAGADIDLHLTADTGYVEKVKQLIAAGADVNARDNDARTALYLAVLRGHTDVVEALASSGADVNAENRDAYDQTPGEAPLHKAAQLDDLDAARTLLAHGADIHICNWTDETPLHVAAYSGSTSVVEMLLSHGADPNAKGVDRRIALDYAQEAGFKDIVRLLGGDAGKAKSGPYRVTITDANAIQSFLGRSMNVDGVWTPDEGQLREFEVTLKTHLRERTTRYNELSHVLMDLRRFHREYAGFVSKGKRFIACHLYVGNFDEKPLANRFSGPADKRWGFEKVIFDVDNKAIVRISRI
jgi:cytohesin